MRAGAHSFVHTPAIITVLIGYNRNAARNVRLGSNFPAARALVNGWLRRILPVAPRPREGPLTKPTAGAQPWSRDRVLMPPLRSFNNAATHPLPQRLHVLSYRLANAGRLVSRNEFLNVFL
jgi:hypothetical protein